MRGYDKWSYAPYKPFLTEIGDIYICRTAMNGAHNYHDSNYSTFHRIKNFRDLK